MNPTRKELKQAVKDSRAEPRCAVRLCNGWFVVAGKIFQQIAHPGPAWSYHYFLVSPTGKRFGGVTRADSLVSYFGNPNFFQWIDDYKGNRGEVKANGQ